MCLYLGRQCSSIWKAVWRGAHLESCDNLVDEIFAAQGGLRGPDGQQPAQQTQGSRPRHDDQVLELSK